jgi:phenylpyruvate tautomerase PptA (4-oxalocrotonate tautomerase family)
MPTYVCTTSTDALDDAKRSAVASAIAQSHSEATGAPAYFVQTNFIELPAGRRYLGGKAIDTHVWINGNIRAGRTLEQREQLLRNIMTRVASIMNLKESEVWVYLNNLQPSDMIEYGHVLPAPGQEEQWFDDLPEALREYLSGLSIEKPGTAR